MRRANCWSKFCSVPVTLHKDNKRRGYNLLLIMIRISGEAGLITPQERVHAHPHLATKLMKILCAARASIFQDYLIGRAELMHLCLLPSSHHCDWANLNLRFWSHFWWQVGVKMEGHAQRAVTKHSSRYKDTAATSRCQKHRQKKKRGYKRGDWEMRQSWLIPTTLPSI